MTPRSLATIAAAVSLLVAAVPFAVAAASTAPSSPDPGAGFGPDPVTPHEPRTDAWADVVDGLGPAVEPGAANPCTAGEPRCLEVVVAEMQARTDALGCDHAAPFAFTYLETTRGVEEHVRREGFFDDPAEIAHLDALFATLYFDAIDNWQAGRHDQVPPAWRIAFDAADEQRVTAAVDVLLGMNAHIGRDLAYAVARQLADEPVPAAHDPADFFRVDDVIDVVREPMLAGAAQRYDPELTTLTDMLLPAGTEVDATRLISVWREQAYGFGVRLAAAEDAATREAVAAEIERSSVASAVLLLNFGTSRELGLPPAERARYCDEGRAGS